MARGINKVILIGNLGQDPESRAMPSGNTVTNLSLATSDQWVDKQSGQKQERTEWHRVAVFGKIAEAAAQYLKKGSKVYVEGKLKTRKWQDQQGNDRYTTEVVVDMGGTLQFLDGVAQGDGQQQTPPPAQNAYNQARQGNAPAPQPGGGAPPAKGGFDDFDDEIPFN